MFLAHNERQVEGVTARLDASWFNGCRLGLRATCRPWLAVLMLLTVWPATAQEALQNSVAGEVAAQDRSKQMQSPEAQDYTFKKGDFRLLVTPALSLEWNDNVNLSNTDKLDDYILTPSVGFRAIYPLTQRNLLYLDVSVGYARYLNHPDLSTFELNSSSGTGLSFDLGVKDVTINFHDWMSYTQDGAENGTVANTANYGTFQNTAGLAATWDLNQITLSAGYDHQNVIATSGEFDNINHSAEMLFVRSGFQLHPQVTAGLESTAAFTKYDGQGGSSTTQNELNNNDAYTVGPYVTFRYSEFMSVTARGGYATYQFDQTSSDIETSSQDTWYAGLTFSHQPRESISYSIDAGREVQLGTESDLVEDWYVRPNVTWNMIKDWTLSTGLFYEHGKQGVGSDVTGNLDDSYDWYGGNLSLQHELTSRLSVALSYRLTLRSSDSPDDEYTQNLVGIQLTYHPK
jgi:hypothetical protein